MIRQLACLLISSSSPINEIKPLPTGASRPWELRPNASVPNRVNLTAMTTTLPDAVSRLREHVSSITPLTDAEWDELVPHLTLTTLTKQQCFIRQGAIGNQVALVLDGVLRQFYTKDGEERTTYFFFENQLVSAYMSCVTGRPSPVTIEALSETTCLCFPYPVLQSLFSQHAGWQQFGRLIAEQIMVALEERMAGLLMLTPEERYLALLVGNQKELLQRVPQHYIASYLGITPVSMSRIRNRIMGRSSAVRPGRDGQP